MHPSDSLRPVICGYCHASFATDEQQIAHDIRTHTGLQRVRDDHRLLCEQVGGSFCLCNVAEFERVNARIERGEI